MRFVPVDPKEIANVREGRRGRVSYPILKMFLEQEHPLVKLDMADLKSSKQSLTSSLNAYIRAHDLPVRLFQRSGDIYLVRTDVEGTEHYEDPLMKHGTEQSFRKGSLVNEPVKPITAQVVDDMFVAEQNQVTK